MQKGLFKTHVRNKSKKKKKEINLKAQEFLPGTKIRLDYISSMTTYVGGLENFPKGFPWLVCLKYSSVTGNTQKSDYLKETVL